MTSTVARPAWRDHCAPGTTVKPANVREAFCCLAACLLALFGAADPLRADASSAAGQSGTASQISPISQIDPMAVGAGATEGISPLASVTSILGSQGSAPLMLGLNISPDGLIGSGTGASPSASGLAMQFYAPAATNSAGVPLPGAAIPETTGLTDNLMLAKPGDKSGDGGLSLSGMYYLSNGSHALDMAQGQSAEPFGQAISQTLSYKMDGLSLGLGYRDVAKGFAGADALNAMAAQEGASSVAAVKDLLSHTGQSDVNMNLGFTGTSGFKAGFLLDNLTDQNAERHTQTETFSFEQALKTGLDFSATHVMVDSDPLLGGPAADTSTDHLHLAFAQPKSGLSLSTDETIAHLVGSTNDQTAVNLADKLGGASLAGSYTANNTEGATPDSSASEHLALTDPLSRAVSLALTWDGGSDARNACASRNDFDSVFKASFAKSVALATEFVNKDDGGGRTQDLHTTVSLPSFAGMTKAAWTLDFSELAPLGAPDTHKWDIAFDSALPAGKTKLPPTLPGASLHLEYAGNIVGVTPGSTQPAANQSARALRIVSGPTPGNWLSWSIYQQMNSASGVCAPSVRDYQVQLQFLRGSTLAYANDDELPLAGLAVKSSKTQDLKLTAPLHLHNKPIQVAAEYMDGSDHTDGLATTQSVSLGVSGPVSPKANLDMSLGRTRQMGLDGGYANGTTYKIAYNCTTSQTDLLNFTSTVTCWDSGGSRLVAVPVQASAQLSFKRTYW